MGGDPKLSRNSIKEALREAEKFVEEAKKALGFPIVPDGKTGSAVWYSQREISLRYLVSVERIRKFFENLSEGALTATKCSGCSDVFFPPQSFCPKCMREDLEWVLFSGEGAPETYTKILVKPLSFSHYEDYVVGVVRLPEGVNVVSWIRAPIEKLRVGMRVKLRVSKRNPEGYLTYEFEPVED